MAYREIEELESLVGSFRLTDLESLLSSFGPSFRGRKHELQQKVSDILRNPYSGVDIISFKQRIRQIGKSLHSSSFDLTSQMQMQHKMAANRAHPQQRSGMNPYGANMYQHPMQHQHVRSGIGPNTLGYQPSLAHSSNNYGSAMYSTPSPAQHILPTPTRICNTSNEVQIVSTPTLSSANITFRKLPFYKVKYSILKPVILSANSVPSLPPTIRTTASQEFSVSFILTCDMASELAMNRDMSKNEYIVQTQIRITAIDSSVTTNVPEYDDFLPLGLVIRVNGRQCNTLPPCSPSSRQGVESRRIPRPISVTQLIKMSPMNVNTLTINWAHEIGKTFVVSLNVVEKLSSEFLLNKLKARPTISVDITKLTIRQQYKRVIDDDDDGAENANADDDDIATTIVRVSLQCPLAKFRMMFPAKGKNCSHLQCFDGSAYISLNEKRPMWMCPVCSRPLYYDDLLLDQYFMEVLQSNQLSDDCQEVQLLVDGSWKSYDEENSSENNDKGKNQSSPGSSPQNNNPVVNPADSSDDTNRKDITVSQPAVENGGNVADPVVDLTCEDEDMPESAAADDERAPVVSEERKNSNPSSLPSAFQPVDREKMKDVSPAEVSPVQRISNAEPVAAAETSSVAEEAIDLPIISLDSPSPPSFSAATTPALDGLNIEDP